MFLQVGYSIFGAFIFSHLEGENEIKSRTKVDSQRSAVLDDLWKISGKDSPLETVLRVNLIFQMDCI